MSLAWLACLAVGATSGQRVVEVDGERFLAPLDATTTSTIADEPEWLPPRADPSLGFDVGSGFGFLFLGSDTGPAVQPAFGLSFGVSYRFSRHFSVQGGPWLAVPYASIGSASSANQIGGVLLGLAAGPGFRAPLSPTTALVAGVGVTAAWGSTLGGNEFGGAGLNGRAGLEIDLTRAFSMAFGGQGGGTFIGSGSTGWVWAGVDFRFNVIR